MRVRRLSMSIWKLGVRRKVNSVITSYPVLSMSLNHSTTKYSNIFTPWRINLTFSRKSLTLSENEDYQNFVKKFDFLFDNYHKIITQVLGITLANISDDVAAVFNKFYRLIMEIKKLASKITDKIEHDLDLKMTDNILLAVRTTPFYPKSNSFSLDS